MLQELHKYADQNEEHQQLKAVIWSGFPNHQSKLNEMCKRYVLAGMSQPNSQGRPYGVQMQTGNPQQMWKKVLMQLHE